MGWFIFAGVLLLWSAVAVWRTVVFVGESMLESWRNGEEYSDMFFGEAVRAGLIAGFAWPLTAPFRVLGNLLYGWAHGYADRIYRANGGKIGKPELDITGELEKVEDKPIPTSRAQARLRREAEAGREEYQARRLDDVTAVGTIPAYPARHADE